MEKAVAEMEQLFKCVQNSNSLLFKFIITIAFGWPLVVFALLPNNVEAPYLTGVSFLWLFAFLIFWGAVSFDLFLCVKERLERTNQHTLGEYEKDNN